MNETALIVILVLLFVLAVLPLAAAGGYGAFMEARRNLRLAREWEREQASRDQDTRSRAH